MFSYSFLRVNVKAVIGLGLSGGALFFDKVLNKDYNILQRYSG